MRAKILAVALLCVAATPTYAQTPMKVVPGYQSCSNASGSTVCNFIPTDLSHGFPVDLVAGSVTANLAPFTPSAAGSRGTPLTVSTTDVSGTIPTNTGAVTLSNPGATTAYCNVVGAVATTADFPIAPGGGAVLFGVPSGVTTFHCISTGAGTTINSVGGAGLGAFTGGGGGSGGGGGTVAQGTGGASAWLVTGAGGTFPVTGTFWQATQPVSGTFWQATQPISVASAAPVPSAAIEATHVLKSSAGSLLSLTVSITTVSGWVMVFDAVTAPADGAVTPKFCRYIKSDGTGGATSIGWPNPMSFTTGISVAFSSSTTGCFNKTASSTAMFSGQVQ